MRLLWDGEPIRSMNTDRPTGYWHTPVAVRYWHTRTVLMM